MTYKHLKQFLENNITASPTSRASKFKINLNTKIIFIVGEDASNVASFLSSVMSEGGISHSRYVNAEHVEIKDRFLQNGKPSDTKDITESARLLLRRANSHISTEELLCGVALEILKNDYLLLELSYPCCREIFKNTRVVPHTLLLTSVDDEKNDELIDLSPSGTGEIISATGKDDYDYLSTARNKNGTRVSYVSQNKFTVSVSNLLGGTQFFYFSDPFRIPSINLCNARLAALAIETSRVSFSLPNFKIRAGLEQARLICDFKLNSIDPIAFINVGNKEYKLHHSLKHHTIIK